MAWGDPKVTRRRIQADNSIPYSIGNATLSIQHVGFIKELLLRLNAVIAYTKSVGGSTQDQQGPWNLITLATITVNGIGTFLSAPFWMLYLYDLVHYGDNNFDPASSENVNVLQEIPNTDNFSFPAVPGASGNITLLGGLRFPFTMELAGLKEIGLFVLQNDEINVQITPAWNSVAASATKLTGPYDIAGGDTFAITTASTNLDVVRTFYAVPASKGDYPTTGWFHQLEWQRVSMTSTQTEIAHPKGGVIMRVIYQTVDGATAALMPKASLSRLQWLYGSNETPYDEQWNDATLRARAILGHDLPIGVAVHDFFRMGYKTMRDTFDTQEYQNLRTRILTPSTPSAGSYVDVLRERLIPIGNAPGTL